MSNPLDTLSACAKKYSEAHDADVVAYLGDLKRPRDDWLIDACRDSA